MEVLISSTGEDKIERRFNRFAKNAGSAKTAFVEISAAIAAANEKNWGRGVKLAESTLADKQADPGTYGPSPLVKSGRLKESLTRPEAGDAIRLITDHEMVFGTRLYYARFVQKGFTHLGGEHVPSRKVLRFPPSVRALVKALINRHLMS